MDDTINFAVDRNSAFRDLSFHVEMADKNGRQTTSPCAACKLLRRRCTETCLLAPFFPQNDPQRFADAHRVFGASNIVKTLEDIPMEKRADGINSMVYEARARLRDPVYGCAGTVWQLQQQISHLQSEKATLQAQLLHMHLQQANLQAALFLATDKHDKNNGEIVLSTFDRFSPCENNTIVPGGSGSDEEQPHSQPCDRFWT